ncbi:uncharacterized protein A1O5_03114 [Cladophialophora psammophila CBS 110553]|uniref:aldehyde dehydrogenase (NAD(+)) n=1 Tax=Cladophialophora psammophila CBS 110553 TaxID=1182543 RepID=W9XSV8_9EURO|nr:uncharacterized protein A1O5_03114 [Cladophialophora psammophila CBS 110553]EXJ73354.1 hypothetical protein A1O5_03114 [Cladophialophora psammophila CBS 110553]
MRVGHERLLRQGNKGEGPIQGWSPHINEDRASALWRKQQGGNFQSALISTTERQQRRSGSPRAGVQSIPRDFSALLGNGAARRELGWETSVIEAKLSETPSTTHNINPATGKANAEVPLSRPQDVDDAVNAARRAFKHWANIPFAQRREAVLAFAGAIKSHRGAFAKVLTQEQGKAVNTRHHFAHTRTQPSTTTTGTRSGIMKSMFSVYDGFHHQSALPDTAAMSDRGFLLGNGNEPQPSFFETELPPLFDNDLAFFGAEQLFFGNSDASDFYFCRSTTALAGMNH